MASALTATGTQASGFFGIDSQGAIHLDPIARAQRLIGRTRLAENAEGTGSRVDLGTALHQA